jgi:hypothetical protein
MQRHLLGCGPSVTAFESYGVAWFRDNDQDRNDSIKASNSTRGRVQVDRNRYAK